MERVTTVFCLCVFLSLVNSDDGIQRQSKSCEECELKIPLEMALKLNTITDENQLFREFISKEHNSRDVETPMVKSVLQAGVFGAVSDSYGGSAGGDEQLERKAISKAKPAGCIPELRSVSLRESNDPWIYYWPSCTRIEQCGGCCSHKLLSCQPTEVEQLNFQVVVTEYVGNQLQFKGKEMVTREKHTKCKCDCIVKEKDCNALQEYRKGECRCVCKNKDAEAKCVAEGQTKHWNSETCSCECLKVFECSTGTIFNESTCSAGCFCTMENDHDLARRCHSQIVIGADADKGCDCDLWHSCCEEESRFNRFGSTDIEDARTTQKTPLRNRWPINYLFGNGK